MNKLNQQKTDLACNPVDLLRCVSACSINDSPRTCFRMFHVGLRSPRPRLDVTPLFEGEDEAAVADDGAVSEPLEETFARHVDDDLAVSGTGAGGKRKEMCD